MQNLITLVQAVEQADLQEARSRIPPELQDTHPYSVNALWTYYARTDHDAPGDSCAYCKMFDGQTFTGDSLRATFPDHYWKGPDIYANVHKTLWGKEGTCTCLLIREPNRDRLGAIDLWSNIGVDWKEQPPKER